MKIFNLIKLHLNYIISKAFLIILLIIVSLLLFLFITLCKVYLPYDQIWMNQNNILKEYYLIGFNLIKTIITLLIIYIFGHSFIEENDNYILVIIKNRNMRITYFITKLFTLIIISVIIILITYIIYTLIGIIFIPSYSLFNHIIEFSYLFVMILFYGSVTILIMNLYNKSISYIFVMISFIIFDGIIEYDSDRYNLLQFIFPSLIQYNETFILSNNIIYIISLSIFYYLISLILYYQKDR